jgi:hypothetical protein
MLLESNFPEFPDQRRAASKTREDRFTGYCLFYRMEVVKQPEAMRERVSVSVHGTGPLYLNVGPVKTCTTSILNALHRTLPETRRRELRCIPSRMSAFLLISFCDQS